MFEPFIYSMAGAVILLMVMLIVIAYLSSKFFKLPNLEVFAKVELYELIISILILLSAEAFFLFSGSFSMAIADGHNQFEVARNFHAHVMVDGVFPAVKYCYSMILTFSTLNTFHIRPNDSVWTWFYKICPGSDLMVAMFNLLVYGLVVVMSTLNIHMYILTFAEATMGSIFLPAGVLLRFFPPTRKAGIFLIVFSIAFYAIYPTMYALDIQILNKIAEIETGTAQFDPFPSDDAFSQMVTVTALPFTIATGIGSFGNFIGNVGIPGSSILQSFFGFMVSESFLMVLQPQLFAPALDAIASLSLVTFFLPALSMIVTIAFINGVTSFVERKVG